MEFNDKNNALRGGDFIHSNKNFVWGAGKKPELEIMDLKFSSGIGTGAGTFNFIGCGVGTKSKNNELQFRFR